jgi:hypothetical protein
LESSTIVSINDELLSRKKVVRGISGPEIELPMEAGLKLGYWKFATLASPYYKFAILLRVWDIPQNL